MADHLTREEVFTRALASLDDARRALNDARGWLHCDSGPLDPARKEVADSARRSVLNDIGDATNLIDKMKRESRRALESLGDTTT